MRERRTVQNKNLIANSKGGDVWRRGKHKLGRRTITYSMPSSKKRARDRGGKLVDSIESTVGSTPQFGLFIGGKKTRGGGDVQNTRGVRPFRVRIRDRRGGLSRKVRVYGIPKGNENSHSSLTSSSCRPSSHEIQNREKKKLGKGEEWEKQRDWGGKDPGCN